MPTSHVFRAMKVNPHYCSKCGRLKGNAVHAGSGHPLSKPAGKRLNPKHFKRS